MEAAGPSQQRHGDVDKTEGGGLHPLPPRPAPPAVAGSSPAPLQLPQLPPTTAAVLPTRLEPPPCVAGRQLAAGRPLARGGANNKEDSSSAHALEPHAGQRHQGRAHAPG